MTTGIYALYWEEEDLIYIGLSSNIEKRFNEHMHALLNDSHSNIKVTEANKKFGPPKFLIIEECTVEELGRREVFWTNEFNSLNSGLNIVPPGGGMPNGIFMGSSKYSLFQILRTFRLLSGEEALSAAEVSKLTGVSKDTVTSLYAGNCHNWLRSTYPYRYSLMLSRKSNKNKAVNTKGKTLEEIYGSIEILSPTNEVYIVSNITDFARKHNLDQAHLSKVINKQRKSHKGWTLKPT